MANIREIEVNGEKYGIESINDMAVSYDVPSGDVKPGTWLKPSGVYDLQSTIGLERKPNSTSSYGDYTLDEEGNLVETTDQDNATGTRCTKMFGLFREREYFLENINNNTSVSSGQLWTWDVFFYDINHNFISKSSGHLEEGTTLSVGNKVVDFVMPTEARYVRIRFPYNKPYYFSLVDAEANVAVSGGGMYGGSYYEDHIYKLDGDHYVMV